MEAPKSETLPPPPSVINAIRAGFDTVTVHLTAILLPLALDLFLWLGPRLNVEKVTMVYLKMYREMAGNLNLPSEPVQQFLKMATAFWQDFNLFSALSTFPIGISSLVRGLQPADNPLGAPHLLMVTSTGGMLGWMFLFVLAGWLVGAVYFRWVASLALPQGQKISLSVLFQSFSLSALYMILLFVIGMPLMLFLFMMFAISPILGQGLFLFLGFISIWVVVPLYFAGHGIFLRGQNLFASILSGIRLARFTLPTSSLFVLLALVISTGLDYLWSIPKSNSWMLAVGIFGHAFITTALLAASFIYYRDTTTWLQIVFDKLKAGAAPRQA
jgi:hypothetical protein